MPKTKKKIENKRPKCTKAKDRKQKQKKQKKMNETKYFLNNMNPKIIITNEQIKLWNFLLQETKY